MFTRPSSNRRSGVIRLTPEIEGILFDLIMGDITREQANHFIAQAQGLKDIARGRGYYSYLLLALQDWVANGLILPARIENDIRKRLELRKETKHDN